MPGSFPEGRVVGLSDDRSVRPGPCPPGHDSRGTRRCAALAGPVPGPAKRGAFSWCSPGPKPVGDGAAESAPVGAAVRPGGRGTACSKLPASGVRPPEARWWCTWGAWRQAGPKGNGRPYAR